MKAISTPSSTRITNRRALILASSIASLFATEKAVAATGTWSGLTGAVWADDTNWSAPFPVLGDTATFDNAGNGNLIIDLGGGVTVGNIAFDSGAVAAYTLGTGAADSQSLTLGNGGAISMSATVAANQLVNAALTLGNDGTAQTFTLANASTTNSLTVAGRIAGSTGAGVKTLAVAGAGATTLSGVISNGTGGTVAISQTGTGALNLSNTGNTFSGGVTVGAAAGVVTATTFNGTNVTGLGSGAVSIGAGSTVNLMSTNTVATATTINNTFTGTGLLKLTFTGVTATNTFLNGVSGFGGTIQLSNTGVNGDKLNTNANYGNLAASLIIDNGSSLFVTGNSTTNFNGGITLSGTGNSENRGVIRLGAGVLGGNISLAGNSTIGLEGGYITGNISAAGASTLTFGGTPTGNGTLSGNLSDGPGTLFLTKANTGTLWLTGTNNFTGATTVSGGRLQLGVGGTTGSLNPNSAISVSSGASLTFNRSNAMAQGTDFGLISGAGNVTQNGTGTTTFGTATAQTYTGQTQVNRGTLALNFANMVTPTNIVDPNSALNLGGGTLSVLGNGVGTTAQTFNGTTFSPGRSVVAPNRGTGTSTTVTLGALTNGPGSAVHFTPTTAWAAGGAGVIGAASLTEIVTVASVTRNGTAITMPGAGSFAFIGANMFNGTGSGARYVVAKGAASGPYQLVAMPSSTALAAGTGLAPTIVHQLAGNITLSASASSYALIPNGGATLALGTFNYTANGILGASTTSATISGGGSMIIGPEKDMVVNLANTGSVTISSVIANNGAGASSVTVSSTGTGLFTPSGANTYTGGTYFNSGTTVITTDSATASTAAQLGNVPAAATAGHLTFNGGTLQLSPTAALTINAFRGVALGASGGTINLTTAFAVTANSIIAGIGGLTLSNTSTSTLAIGGVNTYTGGTTIGGTGIIVAGNVASPFGVGGILTLNGGQLRANTTADRSIANPVNIAANTTFPTVAAEKSLIFTGPATFSGTRTLTSSVGSTVAGITVQFSNGISESSALSGLIKAGTGNLTLGGLNTFTGPTTINAGRLAYTKTFALYANNPANWTDTNITVANAATMMLSVGGVNEFTSANVATIAGLGTATGGFQTGATLGLDTTNGSLTHSAAIVNPNAGANAINLLKIGANTLTLNSNNTYTGTTTIQGGTVVANGSSTTSQININGGTNTTLQVTNPSATGTGSINIATGVTTPSLLFRLDGGGNISLPNSLIGNSGITTNIDVNNNGTGTNGVVQLNGLPTTGIGNVNLNVTGGNGYSLHIASIFSSGGANGTTLINPTTANVSFGNISSITNNFAYNWQFDGTTTGNAVTGAITNGSGPLSVTKANTSIWNLSGNNTYTGATTVNAGTLILSGTNTGNGATAVVGGTLQAGANGALNPNSAVTMTDAAAAILDLNGKLGTIPSLSGGGPLGGNVTLGGGTLTTGDTTSTTYSGNVTGAGNLIKVGVGAFTLATPQSYTGTTAVNGGSLIVNSTLASSATTVGNSGTLGGTGTLSGTVTVNSGGMLSPATATTAGTINIASLTLDAGSGIAYEFGATNDLVAVTNASGLTLNGGALSLFATGGVSALTANGTYTLFSYLTGFGGALTNLSVANAQAGKTYSVADGGGIITLTIGTAIASDWTGGATDGLWTTASNWTGGTPNSVGAVATFGLNAVPAAPTSVAVNGPKTVGSIIFDNANAYTVSGGAGDTITLDNGIASGAISVTSGSHTVNAPIVLNGAANITPGAGTTLTLGGVISGAKTVAFSGAGTANVSGANTYSAGTTLVSGTLSLANGSALGTGTFTITGGTIDAASALALTTNNAQIWSGDFAFAGTNSLNLGNGAVSVPLARTVTTTAGTLTIGGVISGSSITKAGNGTLALAGNNTFTGALNIAANGGTVVLSGDNSARPAATTGQTVVNTGGTLQLQANAGNTTAGVSTALSAERTANQPLLLNTGGTLQLRSDSAVTFAGANSVGGLGSATVSIDVDQLTGAGTNNAITIAPGGFNVSGTTINVTGANGYSLRLPAITSVGANTSTFNGNSAPISIGNYTGGVTGAHFLGLGGTNAANVVTGIISNGSATSVAVTKTGSGTWELSGINTYSGTTTVTDGTLILSGARTGTSNAISVSTVAGLSATLNITNGTYALGAAQINVGNAVTTAATGTVNQSGGAISFTGGNALLIGQNTVANTGIYNLSGGSITTFANAARGIMLGVNDGAFGGTFNLSGTGQLNMTAASGGGGDAALMIGRYEGTAPGAPNTTNLFNQTGGTANVGILSIGGLTTIGIGINSTLTLTGGVFAANQFARLSAGNTNTSTINIGGTADVTLPAFPTARGTSSTATINFDGGTLRPLAASATYMGSLTNAFVKAGGVKFDTGAFAITVTQALLTDAVSTGGGLTKAGSAVLTLTGANTYTGKTTVTAGGITYNSIGNVGAGASALGAPTTVAEGTIDLSGTLTYTGAATSTDRVINLTNAAANASITNSGTGLLTLNGNITGNALNLLYRGNGNITMNGLIPSSHTGPVTHTETSTLTLTNPANAWTGALVVSKGTVSIDSIANKTVASAAGAGSVITLGQSGFNNTGTLQFTGASGGSTDRDIDIQSNLANANGGVIENTVVGQVLTLDGDITVGGTGTLPTLGLIGAGNGALNGDILGASPLAITKSGTGTWTLGGIDTNTGATTVNAGTLIVSGSISGSAVTVNNTGTLGGSGGTVGAITATSGGTVSPGASIGTLNSGSASFAAGSTFALEINTTTTTTDLLAVTGNISLAATNNTILSVTDLAAGIYDGTPLPFITYTGVWDGNLFSVLGTPIADEGTFTVGANTFTLDYNYGGNSIALIPEPGSAALMLGGLATLAFRRRRRA